MGRTTRNIWAGAVAAGLVAIFVNVLSQMLHGDEAPAAPAGKLVVHEWGTFTGFAGTNGVNLEFRPLVTNDLPQFVMNVFNQPNSQIIRYTKQTYFAMQRMETPVTYFYTDVPRVVNVRVDFPDGMLTEWYPVVKRFEPPKQTAERTVQGRTFLDWGAVRLTPPEQFDQIKMRTPGGAPAKPNLQYVPEGNHYGAARETDSAYVETVDADGASHFEKFLFYRGIGNFELPIKMAALGNDRFEVSNLGELASGALVLVRIDNNVVRFARSDALEARSSVEIILPKTESSVDELAAATVRELVAAGLYQKEAQAMVNTWRTSWFGENGTRLLYLVPQKLTDAILPLSVSPAPDEAVRVLVGRLETLTPEDCRQLTSVLAGDRDGRQPPKNVVRDELAKLGRFAEPAVQFVISQTSDPQLRGRLELVLAELRLPKTEP